MRRLLIVGIALSAVIVATGTSQPAAADTEGCYLVSSTADARNPQVAITLTASESLRCPVVWAPAGADFLCVEPQSHAIGAPSEPAARAAAPLRRLAPGEILEGWLRIAPEAL